MEVTQSSGFLLGLLRDVAEGRTLPAAMQRPYVWRKPDVEALCDSILSGFPVGAFLMWSPGSKADLEKVAKGRLGPIQAATPEQTSVMHPYNLLLDGQNRLATLAWMSLQTLPDAVEGLSPAELETWLSGESLVLDWATRSLRFVPTAEAGIGLRLPAWTLVSNHSVGSFRSGMELVGHLWRSEWKDLPENEVTGFINFYDQCGHRFRDARVAVTVIERATAEEARHAFLRICRVGVPMDQADFDYAVGWVPES